MVSRALAVAFALTLGIGAARPADALTIASGFDAGLEGWTAAAIALSWQPAGGNPGGYLRGDDLANTSYLIAPAAFLGDLSAFDGGWMAFDHIAIDLDGFPTAGAGGEVTIFSGAQSATADLLTPSTSWQTGTLSLTAAAWGVDQASWSAILANVTAIHVVIDSTFGVGTDGFDNFTIVTPEPATALLLACGMTGIALCRRRRAATPLDALRRRAEEESIRRG
jgi:hypothetical protein